MILSFVLVITFLLGTGFLAPVVLPRHWRFPRANALPASVQLSLTAALLGSLLGVAFMTWRWRELATPDVFALQIDLWGIHQPHLPVLHIALGVDRLGAFFVVLVSAFSALVAIYSFGALRAAHFQKQAPSIVAGFNLFIWATLMVIIAYDIFSLLLSLEIMTLAFGYLTLYKHRLYLDEGDQHEVSAQRKRNARIAPMVYMIISHTSTAFLLAALLMLSTAASDTGYGALIANASVFSSRSPAAAWTVFLLALIGLGIRSGLSPAHIWVPLVHPSSPTTTHALSLGIAIKVAVYLMYRFFFQFLSPQPAWGLVLLLVAAFTAIVNVWYAISSHDLKEALAYHSIENIGIIVVGIGLAMIVWESQRALAMLALLASIYHLLNHAVFKGLLYMATGAIENLTHQTIEIDRLGGLVKRYPFTSAMFLVGSFAIAGFPPFNGFISEWLTLRAFFHQLAEVKLTATFMLVLLALLLLVASFALTAFCFYKMAGVTLLGLPRSPKLQRDRWHERDVHFFMQAPMLLMAALCLALGVVPGLVAPFLTGVFQPLDNHAPMLAMPGNWQGLSLSSTFAQAHIPVLSLIAVAAGIALILLLLTRGKATRRPAQAWGCSAPSAGHPITQFSSGGASYLFRRAAPLQRLPQPLVNAPEYLPARFVLSESPKNPQTVIEIFRSVVNLFIGRILRFSQWFGKQVQNRDVRRYLLYVFVVDILAILLFLFTAALVMGGA